MVIKNFALLNFKSSVDCQMIFQGNVLPHSNIEMGNGLFLQNVMYQSRWWHPR
jgi:hypothetical protein